MVWKRACAVEDVAPGDAIVVEATPSIAVFNVNGEWLATADRCSHSDSSLADGYIDGDVVECSWHFARFCIRTGAVLSPPATKPVRTFQTRVTDGIVHVEVPEDDQASVE